MIHGLVSPQHGEERAPPADVLRYLLLLSSAWINHFGVDLCLYVYTVRVTHNSISTQRAGLVLQVRRLTGALVAVGQGQLSVAQLRDLLEARDTRAYPQGTVAPACGLFLTRVDYNQSGEMTTKTNEWFHLCSIDLFTGIIIIHTFGYSKFITSIITYTDRAYV